MIPTLKPCPHCGCYPRLFQNNRRYVKYSCCGMTPEKYRKTVVTAMVDWNDVVAKGVVPSIIPIMEAF